MITIYTDGSSIGNPGKAGVGYIFYKGSQPIHQNSVFLGIQSNNFAEYMALIFALVDAIDLNEKKCKVFADSQLMVEQINGRYKVKNQNLLPLYTLAKQIISKFDDFKISHIDREKNKEADKLAKDATSFLV